MTSLMLELAVGLGSGVVIAAAYIMALKGSLRRIGQTDAARLAVSSILRLSLLAILVALAVWIGAKASHLVAGMAGFMLVRHVAILRVLAADGGAR